MRAARSRWWPVLALAVVLVASTTAIAVGANSGDGGEPPGASHPPRPIAALEAVLERQRQREEALRSREAREARRQSREAYRDATPTEAALAARQQFPHIVNGPLKGLNLPHGHEVKRYLDDHTAIVETGRGGTLVESGLPLRAQDSNGAKRAVDLTLREEGSDLVAEAPLQPVRLPKRLGSASVRLVASDVGVAPVGGNEVDARPIAGAAFYASIAPDTDFLAKPAPRGVEVMVQLRSPASPERHRLKLALPDGAQLRHLNVPADVIEVVRDGERLATMTQPVASDAQGSPVKLSYAAEGDEIVIDLPHRDADYAYPIMVDPTLEDDQRYWHWDWGLTREGWNYSDNPDPAGQMYPDYGETGSGRFGRGLYAISGPATPAGSFGWFRFTAPGQSWIYRVEFYASHDQYYSALIEGVWNGSDNWETGALFDAYGTNLAPWGYSSPYTMWNIGTEYQYLTHCLGNTPCAPYNMSNGQVVSTAGRPGNQAAIGIYKTATPNPNWWSQVWAGGTKVFIQDDDRPSSLAETHSAPPSAWVHDITDVVRPKATDPGLGVKYFNLLMRRPGEGSVFVGQQLEASCGPQPLRCPQNSTATSDYKGSGYRWSTYGNPSEPPRSQPEFTINTRSVKGYAETAPKPLPEGVTYFDIYSYDAVVNTNWAPATWPVRIDRSPPTIAVTSGALWERRNQLTDHRREGLYGPEYPIHVEAADALSGAKSIEIYVDGVSQRARGAHVSVECPAAGGCRRTLDWTLRSDDYGDGKHTVRIVARDGVADPVQSSANDHVAVREFEITIDRHGDIYHATSYSDDPAAGGELLSREWARLGRTEARSEEEGQVATRHTVTCPNPESGSQCDEVRVRVFDGETGHESADNYEVTTGASRDDPRLEPVSDIAQPAPAGELVTTGDLDVALRAWQRPPPNHGQFYEKYEERHVADQPDGTSAEVVVHQWIDQATKLLLKQTASIEGGETTTFYLSYAAERLDVSEVPSDFFAVPDPATPSSRQSSTYSGAATVGPQSDAETQTTLQPVYIGDSAVIGGVTHCFATGRRFTLTTSDPPVDAEPLNDDAPDASGPTTAFDAIYVAVPEGLPCQPGSLPLDEETIMISAYARASTDGAGWIDTYEKALMARLLDDPETDRAGTALVFVAGTPATAYYVPYSDDELAVLVATQSTVYTVKGLKDPSMLQSFFARTIPL